ncbi:retinol dehydrogenase 12-like [Pundamilia nyererei]|uniref:Retinol dehydrogenase 12-like n=1 Tax=Pundamilia nyererei TaxID=303518 RepID=A0A9Y6LZQ3_9CICH|nr:PREDICTED: retinol dehydrogenase 12-like [Pundamilia nyererei]
MSSLRNVFRRSWSCDEKLEGKVVVITGANTGIGKETAIDLAKRGVAILHSHDVGIIVVQHVAKVIFPPPPGHFLLTYLLLDLIKKSAPARIINVSSMAHSWGSINLEDLNSEKHYDKNKAYAQSKLANVLFTRSLAKRLEGTGVTTYSLHPGVVQTELWRHLNGVQQFFMKMVSPFTKNSVQGAQTTIYCAVDPSLEKESGGYYSDCAPANCSAAAKDDNVGEKLWELSCSLLSLTWD